MRYAQMSGAAVAKRGPWCASAVHVQTPDSGMRLTPEGA